MRKNKYVMLAMKLVVIVVASIIYAVGISLFLDPNNLAPGGVTGIATAYMDSIPLVAITCNVGTSLLGKDSFQEIDIAGVVMPITKYSFIVKDVRDLAKVIRRAFSIAKSGRPGPVLVDITKDATANTTEYIQQVPDVILPDTAAITDEDLHTAAELIKEAKRPMIFVGGGAIAADASEELLEFAEKINAPVCDTLMGKGAFSGEHPLYAGMLGMHGTKYANFGVTHCDLLIAIGTRFSDRVFGNAAKFAQNAKVLQIDVDPAEIEMMNSAVIPIPVRLQREIRQQLKEDRFSKM